MGQWVNKVGAEVLACRIDEIAGMVRVRDRYAKNLDTRRRCSQDPGESQVLAERQLMTADGASIAVQPVQGEVQYPGEPPSTTASAMTRC